jgi:hypothetical protein
MGDDKRTSDAPINKLTCRNSVRWTVASRRSSRLRIVGKRHECCYLNLVRSISVDLHYPWDRRCDRRNWLLIGIVRALESIDNGLYTASSSVTGAEANVRSLPDYIQAINSALASVDTALKPIPGQVADVNGSLQSIRGSAQNIDGSLKDTSQSLISTSGSLVNTAGALGSASQSLGNTSFGEQSKPALNVLQAVGGIVNSIPR